MSTLGVSAWAQLKGAFDRDYAIDHALQPAPVPTGVRPLDDALGGGMPTGTFTVLGGEGGCGKSALACVVAYEAALLGRSPVYFSLEMPQHMVISRMLSVHARRRGLRPVWWSTTRNVVTRIAGRELLDANDATWYVANHILSDPVLAAWDDFERTIWPRVAVVDANHGIEWICGTIRALCQDGVRPMPIIDYVQLGADGEGNEYERVTNASHALQAVSKECQVPMLAISSLRNVGKDERKNGPTIGMLRGSGHLGYDAGTVIMLQKSGERQGEQQPVMAYVVKNRVGPSDITVPLMFNGGANEFS